MRRSRVRLFPLIAALFVSWGSLVNAQTLKVELSPDKSKVDRSTQNGTATIFFDSNVDDLKIVCTDEKTEEPVQKIGKKMWFTHIDVKKDIMDDGVCYRNFLLKSSESAEYCLTTPEIGYNQVLYYTVVLPNQFPTTLSAEYLFTKTSKNAVRVSFGKRFGGYLSYKWGDYYKAGADISTITEDYDISNAELLGYIRTAITGGVRIGLVNLQKTEYPFMMNLLVGGGYGEYGRQWENNTEVNRNIYFHSDYIKGFDAELSLQAILCNWLVLSPGVEMIVDKNNITFDYQIGLGLNIPIGRFKAKTLIKD